MLSDEGSRKPGAATAVQRDKPSSVVLSENEGMRNMMNRREAIKLTAMATAAYATLSTQSPAQTAPAGPFALAPLPFAVDALEPHIDAATMTIHHDKHHAAYVANLNKAMAGHDELAKKKVEELISDLDAIPESIRTQVRNFGGGHANHALFWQMLSKNGGGAPKGEVAEALIKSFGSYDKFKEVFTKSALTLFGSGWAWLSLNKEKKLIVESTPNQDSPLTKGNVPLLGIDVWEHAYYLKYQNRRPDYIAAFYNVINWEFVEAQYQKAI
jgi:Fe-Mn family superoxide dismutase